MDFGILKVRILERFCKLKTENFKTVKIGNKFWMAENLNVAVPGSWWYNDDPSTGAKYGRLYTWKAVRISSPAGWRLPTEKDWVQLVEFLGGEVKAGKELRHGGLSGFNACLGGVSSIGSVLSICMGHFDLLQVTIASTLVFLYYS